MTFILFCKPPARLLINKFCAAHEQRNLKSGFFLEVALLPVTFAILNFKAMDAAVKFVHDQLTAGKNFPKFKAGDNVTVNYKIIEGGKERIQGFRGDVIKIQGTGATQTFAVRKISDGVGVERIFPFYSPNIDSVLLNKVGKVRRSKLFYLRERSGKSARIKEKRM